MSDEIQLWTVDKSYRALTKAKCLNSILQSLQRQAECRFGSPFGMNGFDPAAVSPRLRSDSPFSLPRRPADFRGASAQEMSTRSLTLPSAARAMVGRPVDTFGATLSR